MPDEKLLESIREYRRGLTNILTESKAHLMGSQRGRGKLRGYQIALLMLDKNVPEAHPDYTPPDPRSQVRRSSAREEY